METFGLFPQAEAVASAVRDPSVGLVPAWVALQLLDKTLFYCSVLLKLPLLVACGVFFKVPGHYQDSWHAHFILRTSLKILKILRLLQLFALLKNLCCVSKLKESFFSPQHTDSSWQL